MSRQCLLASILAVAGCGPSDGAPAGQGGGDGGGGQEAGDDGGAGSDGGSDRTDPYPSCWRTCDTPSDCSTGSPISDADNFDCAGGLCHYRGCNDTDECVATFGNDDYACGEGPSIAVRSCIKICGDPTDCALATAAFDVDNYRCTGDGLCEYLGCHDDDECVTTFGGGYGCARHGGQRTCTARCVTPDDCVVAGGGPLYDADNYQCAGGFCRFTGCRATDECQASMMSSEYTCTTAD